MHNIRFWQARFYSQEVAIDQECCNSRPSSPSTTGSLARWVCRQFLPRQLKLIDPQSWMLRSLRYVCYAGPSVDNLTFAPVMFYLWHSRTGVDNLDNALNRIKTVTWGSAAIPSICQIVAVSLYNSDSVKDFAMRWWRSLMTNLSPGRESQPCPVFLAHDRKVLHTWHNAVSEFASRSSRFYDL
jgi:hypothetical protein